MYSVSGGAKSVIDPSPQQALSALDRIRDRLVFVLRLAAPSIDAGRVDDAAEDILGALDDLGPELDLVRIYRGR